MKNKIEKIKEFITSAKIDKKKPYKTYNDEVKRKPIFAVSSNHTVNEHVCENCNNFGHKHKTCHKHNMTVTSGSWCNHFDSFKQNFRKITILSGPPESGKTTESIKMVGSRKYQTINGLDHFKISTSGTEVLIFEEIITMKQIKQIIKADLPIKEIIICIQI